MVILCTSVFQEDAQYAEHFDAYGFPLSDFQKHAIKGILEKEHVLVTAHTGSGKPTGRVCDSAFGFSREKSHLY